MAGCYANSAGVLHLLPLLRQQLDYTADSKTRDLWAAACLKFKVSLLKNHTILFTSRHESTIEHESHCPCKTVFWVLRCPRLLWIFVCLNALILWNRHGNQPKLCSDYSDTRFQLHKTWQHNKHTFETCDRSCFKPESVRKLTDLRFQTIKRWGSVVISLA